MEPGDGEVRTVKVTRDNLLRWLAFLTALALLWVALKLPHVSKTEPLRVAVGLWPGAETLILARERGLLPEERFRLVEVTWASAAYRAFDNGVVDAAVLSLDGVLRLVEGGEALRVIFVMDVSQGADAVLARDEIARLEDMKGRRVGVDVRGSGMYLLSSVLATAGMKLADVEVVPLLQPEMETAFEKGDVNAVVASEPWMTDLKAKGGRVLTDSRSISPPIYRVLVVRESTLRDRRDDLVRLLRAHLEMVSLLRAEESVNGADAVWRREGMTKEEFTAALGRVRHLDLTGNRSLFGGGGGGGIASIMAQVGAKVAGEEKSKATLRAAEWTDESIMEEASR